MSITRNARDLLLQAAPSRYSNPPNAAIILAASSPVFHIAAGGAHDPASITFTASLIELAGPVTFVATGGTLSVVGNVATLTYANMPGATATVKATLTENGQSYESNLCNITKVADGTNGTVGLNNARVYAYQRAATAPTLSPGDVTVTFSSNSITSPPALLNGWVRDIPSTNGNPLYVVAISGAGTGSTVDLAASSWSGATVMATDGPGGTGTDGTNGLNAATITIFQRAASATSPAKPSADTTYTFATGVVTGLNNGWTQGVPVNDPAKPYLHTTLATAISASATDTIAASEWAVVQLMYDAAAVIAAQAAADNAADQAALANAAIENISLDSVLDRGEKPEAAQKYGAMLLEFDGILAQADALGVSRTAYFNAMVEMDAYASVANWSNTLVNTNIIRSTFNAKFNDYYTAKTVLLNAIAAKIKTDAAADATAKATLAQANAISTAATAAQAKADLAEVTAKAYADGIVDAEEARAIADATDKANTAQAAATAAAIAADAAIVIGGRNLYKKTTFIGAAYGACTLLGRTESGFNISGIIANDGVMRMYDVIPKNGTFTISFDLAVAFANGYPMRIDFADGVAQTINPTTTVQHFSLTFTVSNWSEATFNFIDFNDLSGQGYYFTNFQIEEGNKATQWNPAPEDVAADAQEKADAAVETAQAYALAKAELAQTTAQAYADGIVDAEEQRAINDATNKAEAARVAAVNAAAADATAKADAAGAAAESAAATYALAKANLAETTAKAYADNVVDAEEARAIQDATDKAEAARVAAVNAAADDATAKANVAATTADWIGISGAGKPADYATAGAPPGTMVGGSLAQTVENWAYGGQLANIAVTDATTGLNTRMRNNADNVLGGIISANAVTVPAGVRAGSLTWNTSGGRTGGSGVAMTPQGLIGYNSAGVLTFYVSASTGDTYYAGQLAAAYGSFGSVTIASGGSLSSGQTAFNTGNGYHLSFAAGVARFSLGNSAGAYLTYDGGTGVLRISGVTYDAFTLAVPNINNSGGAGVRYFSITATPTGGKAPLSYQWSFTPEPGEDGISIQSGSTSATLNLMCIGKASGSMASGLAVCNVVDADGRIAIDSGSIVQNY